MATCQKIYWEIITYWSQEREIYLDHYDPADLTHIMPTQHTVTGFMKKQKYTKLYQILVIVDDFADESSFSRHSKLLHSLYTRGRHNSISTITATQAFTALSTLIRKNATELYIYRLRNYRDLETFIEEVSALYPKKTLLELYNMATSEPYSFLYVNLRAKDKEDMFYMNFGRKLLVED